MNEIASRGQLRLSFLRWAMVVVPSIEFFGFASGLAANSGPGNPWYDTLLKPDFMPPSWAFGAVWPVLYLLIGIALSIVLNARGAPGRGLAVTLFLVQLVCNFLWSPLFFGWHEAALAFYLLLVILALSLVTTLLFARIRRAAALLMLPYLAWLAFASLLAQQVHSLNPDAESLVPPAAHTQI
ncbi:MAG: tryptophan-rich sensory protein [Sphingobium sp.]|nr:tryptophan-rich sensory protein [Sphingobium sp.]